SDFRINHELSPVATRGDSNWQAGSKFRERLPSPCANSRIQRVKNSAGILKFVLSEACPDFLVGTPVADYTGSREIEAFKISVCGKPKARNVLISRLS